MVYLRDWSGLLGGLRIGGQVEELLGSELKLVRSRKGVNCFTEEQEARYEKERGEYLSLADGITELQQCGRGFQVHSKWRFDLLVGLMTQRGASTGIREAWSHGDVKMQDSSKAGIICTSYHLDVTNGRGQICICGHALVAYASSTSNHQHPKTLSQTVSIYLLTSLQYKSVC